MQGSLSKVFPCVPVSQTEKKFKEVITKKTNYNMREKTLCIMFLTVLNNFSFHLSKKRLEPHSVFVSSIKGHNLHISTVVPEQA